MSMYTFAADSGAGRRARVVRLATLAGLLALVATASACGGSSSSATTTTASPAGSGGSSTSSPSASSTTSSAGSATSISQLESKLSKGEAATYAATYDISGVNSGVTTTGTFTLAHSGSSSLVAADMKQGQFEEIDTAGKVDVCVKSSGTWQCFNGGIGEAASMTAALQDLVNVYGSKAALGALTRYEASLSNLTESSGTFAGQAVSCWTFHTKSLNGSYTYCVTSAGVIAEWISKNSLGHAKMVLTSYSTNLPASEFAPPAAPTSLGG
jgi:hypothetical protein